MAEGLCRKFLQERGLCGDITVGSAGIGNSCGNRRPAVVLREFLAGLGIDVAAHRSKPLTEEIVGSADLIVPMTRRQERKILAIFPSAEGKTRLLRSFDPSSDHPDVQDQWEPVSEKIGKAYEAIYPAVLGLINTLAGPENPDIVREIIADEQKPRL
jgi:low molecular weight protein-tyrosine phosphatase